MVVVRSRKDRIERKLRELGFPPHDNSLAFLNSLNGLVFPRSDDWTQHYYDLLLNRKLLVWALYSNHGPTATHSAREPRACESCQIILHREGGKPWAEVDIDRFNPDWGILPLIGHGIWDVGVLSVARWIKRRTTANG